jgi:hypothetical protein
MHCLLGGARTDALRRFSPGLKDLCGYVTEMGWAARLLPSVAVNRPGAPHSAHMRVECEWAASIQVCRSGEEPVVRTLGDLNFSTAREIETLS